MTHFSAITSKSNETGTAADVEAVKTVYDTNLFGVIRVTTAFVPLLKRSTNPVILNISTFLASLTEQNDPKSQGYNFQYVAYNTSKTALNAYTVVLATDFKEARVNCINPGYVATNMNPNGTLTTQESAAGVIKEGVLLEANGPTGKFLDYTGKFEHAW